MYNDVYANITGTKTVSWQSRHVGESVAMAPIETWRQTIAGHKEGWL